MPAKARHPFAAVDQPARDKILYLRKHRERRCAMQRRIHIPIHHSHHLGDGLVSGVDAFEKRRLPCLAMGLELDQKRLRVDHRSAMAGASRWRPAAP